MVYFCSSSRIESRTRVALYCRPSSSMRCFCIRSSLSWNFCSKSDKSLKKTTTKNTSLNEGNCTATKAFLQVVRRKLKGEKNELDCIRNRKKRHADLCPTVSCCTVIYTDWAHFYSLRLIITCWALTQSPPTPFNRTKFYSVFIKLTEPFLWLIK